MLVIGNGLTCQQIGRVNKIFYAQNERDQTFDENFSLAACCVWQRCHFHVCTFLCTSRHIFIVVVCVREKNLKTEFQSEITAKKVLLTLRLATYNNNSYLTTKNKNTEMTGNQMRAMR